MTAIHQIVAGFDRGDAISNEARMLRRLFQGWGCASEIFSERQRILPQLRREARDLGVGPTTLARMWILEKLRGVMLTKKSA